MDLKFDRANISVKEAAKALGMDRQTVRVLIQTGTVNWGRAVKLPGSRKWFYLISPRTFYEETGVPLGCRLTEDWKQDLNQREENGI